ncbi:DNA topoisomerase I [Candidatus Pacearchaeota archaeon]|nr:DNA topoisomerase I [Candidatus Pacearchaeota archaeon]
MPVQDFLPIKDVKHTTEKEEKYRPSIEELTTIESPGRSVPASSLENTVSKTKRKARRRIGKAEPSKIEKPKKDSILIITEKPQAANKIANALGNAAKKIDKQVSYYELKREGKTIIVASAVGHLFGLTYAKGQKGWPVFNLEWHPSYEKKSAEFTKRYYDLLKKLSAKAEEIIIATDYDIEGEVIGWNVLRFICERETAKRMKYSTLTKAELEKSYENPLPNPDWGQAYAGETRHILDWLYGINLSRALMSAIKTSGSFKILSIGRVQGPALKIIVDREQEISNFKSVPFWQVFAVVNNFLFKHPKDIFDKNELEKFKDIKSGTADTTEKEEKIPPLHPFDLTTLQREAYRLHKISPSQTLKVAQKLYLDGLISYPRTSSQKIPDSIEPKKILRALEANFPETELATRSKPVEGKKDDPAHPSIYPTGEFELLEEDNLKIYNLIVKRFISVFADDATTSNKRVKITSDKDPNITFTASGLTIKERGWTKIYPAVLEEKSCPTLNGKVSIDEIKFEEKETQPPKRFTPTSLITILEKKNLGTKSTRSMIIDTLFERGYLDGKSIQATSLGIRLIESLKKYSPIIIDENLTRQLEEEMEKIQESKSGHEKMEKEVIEKVKRLITDIAKEFKAKEIEIGKEISKGIEDFRQAQSENNTIIPCPTCKKGNIRIIYSKKTKRYFAACSAYPECKQTYNLPPNSLIKKAEKDCPECNFPKLLSIKKGKRPWEFCFNPECPVNRKRLEEYREKKEQIDVSQ